MFLPKGTAQRYARRHAIKTYQACGKVQRIHELRGGRLGQLNWPWLTLVASPFMWRERERAPDANLTGFASIGSQSGKFSDSAQAAILMKKLWIC